MKRFQGSKKVYFLRSKNVSTVSLPPAPKKKIQLFGRDTVVSQVPFPLPRPTYFQRRSARASDDDLSDLSTVDRLVLSIDPNACRYDTLL